VKRTQSTKECERKAVPAIPENPELDGIQEGKAPGLSLSHGMLGAFGGGAIQPPALAAPNILLPSIVCQSCNVLVIYDVRFGCEHLATFRALHRVKVDSQDLAGQN
jgi:hypothetical protein